MYFGIFSASRPGLSAHLASSSFLEGAASHVQVLESAYRACPHHLLPSCLFRWKSNQIKEEADQRKRQTQQTTMTGWKVPKDASVAPRWSMRSDLASQIGQMTARIQWQIFLPFLPSISSAWTTINHYGRSDQSEPNNESAIISRNASQTQ